MWKRKWRLLCVLFALLLVINYFSETLPIHFFATKSIESDISVLCYNVRCSDEAYQTNQIGIASEILAELPDVVFLCEFNRSVSKKLDSLIIKRGGYKSYYRSGSNCIFYSKFNIDSIAGIDTETSKGKKALNNSVRLKTPKETITIMGCHLSSSRKDFWGGRSYRVREADSIYKACMKEIRPLIVMGDMNDISGSYPINRIKDAGLKDAWWESGCGYGTTFHGKGLRLRIDHILYDYNGLEIVDVKVLESNLSDHNALIARFKIKNDN